MISIMIKRQRLQVCARRILFFAVGFAWFLDVANCCGDCLVLQNGDRLSGQVVQLSEGVLIFKTQLAGDVCVKIEDIAALTIDRPVQVYLNDGTFIDRQLEMSVPGRVNLVADPNNPAEASTVLLSEIAAIAEIQSQPDKPHWKGNISGGMAMMSGNTSSESISAGIDLQKRSKTDRLTFAGEMAHMAQEDNDTGDEYTIEDWWKLRGKYDYFLTRQLYVFGNGRYETDRVAELTRRVVFGGGPGYQWVESPELNFWTEAGIAEVIEEYDNDTDTTKDISYQLSSRFDGQITRKLKLLHDFSYFPSMEDFSDYYLTTFGEVRYGLTEQMYASLKIILDYDSTPAEDARTTDIKYMLGVGYEF
jgi:putative salt-induced outer membrane protein YdiY